MLPLMSEVGVGDVIGRGPVGMTCLGWKALLVRELLSPAWGGDGEAGSKVARIEGLRRFWYVDKWKYEYSILPSFVP